MRTIKFRGKMIDTGQWIFGDLLQNGSITHISNFDNGVNREHYEVNQYTVGQFTGLIDKNGKEIYEGDVVNVPNFIQLWDEQSDDLTGEIKYLDGAFHINSEEPHFGEVPLLGIYTNEKTTSDIEVIGNVHDNPELI